MWKSGEVTSIDRDMTSLTNRERANSSSKFCWILMIARTNDMASGPEYNEWNWGRRSRKMNIQGPRSTSTSALVPPI